MSVPTALEHQQIGVTADATYWHRVRFELVVREAHRAGCRQLLDYGAGSGLLGDWVTARHPELTYSFAEPSPLLRGRLMERFGTAAEVPDETPIQAGTMVAMLDVLEHIDDDRAALGDLHARMEPGCWLIMTVPALQWAFSSWDVELGHFRRYRRRGLAEMVRAAGFAVTSAGYLFPELFPLLIVRRWRRAPRTHADFPQLDPRLSAIGYRVASLTAGARRWWPFGTSVIIVATQPR